jgi:hypothetical protein
MKKISVELTDQSEAHCLKIVLHGRTEPATGAPIHPPLEIFLHTTQAIDLVHQLSLAICELHHRDSELLLRLHAGGVPLTVTGDDQAAASEGSAAEGRPQVFPTRIFPS